MERKEAIECIRTKAIVSYNDASYLPTAYILRLYHGNWLHSIELHDLHTNNITIAEMEKVKLKASYDDRLKAYESGKRKLLKLALTPGEYEAEVKYLAQKYNI